jgi:[glutamine synthetase] adenylyltransferase / [glutamine synthetase]-adenylyl-L-tyrosine phosphorylase
VQGYTRRLHEKLFYRPLLERFAEVGAEEQLGAEGLDATSAKDRLLALGFIDAAAALRHLDALASGVSRRAQLFRTLLPALLPTLAASPDPDGGLADFRSLADRLGEAPAFVRTLRDNPPVGQLLARVLGASRVVGRWLERQPEVVSSLADLGQLAEPLAPEDYRRLAAGLLRRGDDLERAGASLRRMKRREVARIAVRDLGGHADVEAVGRELSGVAQACLEAGVALAQPDGDRMAVIALGKLGGGELGYASDLDVILVAGEGGTDRHVAAAEELIRLLGAITPEGQAFQVDLNLRPEGKNGPLARTLDSYRQYYERWVEPWELQALTLARPVAGDRALGEAFIELITPFVFPEDVPIDRLQAVRRMKARVERERGAAGRPPAVTGPRRARPRAAGPRTGGVTSGDARGRPGDRIDLKLGPGGLSDVEWTVQLLALRHGGTIPELRQPGTLHGLEVLEAEGLLSGPDAAWLREGWRMLSAARNALYLLGQRDSSTVIPGTVAHERLARLLGYEPPGGQQLIEDLRRSMRRVRKVHERAFYDA